MSEENLRRQAANANSTQKREREFIILFNRDHVQYSSFTRVTYTTNLHLTWPGDELGTENHFYEELFAKPQCTLLFQRVYPSHPLILCLSLFGSFLLPVMPQDTCTEAYLALRSHSRLLVTLFSLMLLTGIPELSATEDMRYLREVLQEEQSEAEAKEHFLQQISECEQLGWTVQANWWIHMVAGIR